MERIENTSQKRIFLKTLAQRLGSRTTMDHKAIPLQVQSKLSEIIEAFISREEAKMSCEAKRAKYDNELIKRESDGDILKSTVLKPTIVDQNAIYRSSTQIAPN